MTLLPVIARELRAESRSAFTYWLRVMGGVALMGIGFIYFLEDKSLGSMKGAELFQRLHVTLFVAIWLVALMMTADSISRERRQGTLELLFLTPLRPFEVVLAKGLAHGLRTAAIMLAAVPVLVVPFLMGGVGWREALAAVVIDFSALGWALAVGLLASSFNRSMTRAMAWSVIGGLCAFVALLYVHGGVVTYAFNFGIPRRALRFELWMQLGWASVFQPTAIAGSPMWRWLGALAVIALASISIFGLVALLAAQGAKRMGRNPAKSAMRQRVEKELFTPTFGLGFYRRWMRRVLERNPVGWLERRTWQARVVTWSWLAVVISLMSWMLGSRLFNMRGFSALSMFLAWLLVANVALTAAGSLRRERETGVIELLLVSPLSIPQIVTGRVLSILGQFLPAAALIFGVWLWLMKSVRGGFHFDGVVLREMQVVWCFLTALLAVPVVGLYFSLRCRMFVVALFWTAVTAIVLPWLSVIAVTMWMFYPLYEGAETIRTWHLGLGAVAAVGALGLLRWRGAGSPGVSVALAAALAVLGVFSLATIWDDSWWMMNSPLMAGLLSGSAFQIGIAAWLGAHLRRRLETRQFALPQ